MILARVLFTLGASSPSWPGSSSSRPSSGGDHAGIPGRERRRRCVPALGAVALVGLGAVFGLVTAANVSTAADPAPALLGFFEGGL